MSLDDGSRLHIHEFATGALQIHRDKIDPGRGPIHAITHWVTESPSGQLLAVSAAAIWALAKIFEE